MQHILLFILWLIVIAPFALAQASNYYPKNEFFIGYSYHSAEVNTLTIDPDRLGQQGFNFQYGRNLTRRIGIVGDVSAHFHRNTLHDGSREFARQRDQYFLLGGLQFQPRRNGSALRPFAHVLVGASLFRGFTSDRSPTGNVYTFDDAQSFAAAVGGGLDVPVSSRVDLRIIQIDYTPTFFGAGRQDNFRTSFGVIFKR